MAATRPAIPAEIKNQLMVECGHRCAVCGEATALEKAHIIPWCVEKEHKRENLVVLCAVCHKRSHDEKWNRAMLHEYKKNPWVARYKSNEVDAQRAFLELTLDLDPEAFGPLERDRVLAAISAVIDICAKDIITLSIRPGSVIVQYSLPAIAAKSLDNPAVLEKLRQLLHPIQLTGIEHPKEPWKSERTRTSEKSSAVPQFGFRGTAEFPCASTSLLEGTGSALLPLVYDELHKLAALRLSQEPQGITLQTTALVHEAYVRLVDKHPDRPWDSRGHFFAAAAEAMRRILIEAARRRKSLKRGGQQSAEPLIESQLAATEISEDIEALHEALGDLATADPRSYQVINLRCFAGLTLEEVASELDISRRTAARLWDYGRAWLRRRLSDSTASGA